VNHVLCVHYNKYKRQRLLVLLHPFNGLFSITAWVSRHQKGEPFWIMGWQWHQLDHIPINCTSLQIDNHASPLSFYRPDALPATQPIASKHRKKYKVTSFISTTALDFCSTGRHHTDHKETIFGCLYLGLQQKVVS